MNASRRRVMLHALGLVLVNACKRRDPFACTDTAGLAPDDAAARGTLAYVEPSMDKTRTCVNCQQYVAAPADGACGTCKVLRGPVHPEGTCKVFAAKA